MSAVPIRLKIKLDVPANTTEYYLLLDQWENEGGAVFSSSEMIPGIDLPIHPGDSFQVIDTNIHFEEDEFYYIAVIQKIAIQEPG